MKISQFLIGIQARSSSTRFPGKCYAVFNNKRSLDYVIDAASNAAFHVNRHSDKRNVMVRLALLVPEGDEIGAQFKSRARIVYGDENDVLSRYKKAADLFGADFIVRITGDCPLIEPPVISKMITIAHVAQYDYIGNCDPRCRTSFDGNDCEIMSSKMLNFLNEDAKSPHDREHVTTRLKGADMPSWAKMGVMIDRLNYSSMKLSLDTKEDLEAIRKSKDDIERLTASAKDIYGKNVHIF